MRRAENIENVEWDNVSVLLYGNILIVQANFKIRILNDGTPAGVGTRACILRAAVLVTMMVVAQKYVAEPKQKQPCKYDYAD